MEKVNEVAAQPRRCYLRNLLKVRIVASNFRMGAVFENEILMHLRSTRRQRNEVSLQDPIGVDREGNEITLMEILCVDMDDLDDVVGRKILFQKMREAVKTFQQRERKVIEMRFGLRDGTRRTQREVAKQLGISRSYVSRIEKKAVKKLCECLAVEGYEVTAPDHA